MSRFRVRQGQVLDFLGDSGKKDLGGSGSAELLLLGSIIFVGLIRWLEKPPDLLVTQTHDPKMKEVPASIAGKPKAKDAIEFF